MSHTPGPWKNAGLVGGGIWITDEGSNNQVAVVYGPGVNAASHDNARLIAAAPELLEALKRIHCIDCKDGVLLIDSLLFDLDREDEDQSCPNCAIRLTAIAKAEGRS